MFYTNFTVRGPSSRSVIEVLRSAERDAWAATVEDTTVVCDRMADAFDPDEIELFARLLSSKLRTPVLTAINHDDDVLLCLLHAGTELIFQYTSNRGYFGSGEPGPEGDDPALLAQAFRREDRVADVRRVLELDVDDDDGQGAGGGGTASSSAADRHTALCDALGLPRIAVGVSYDGVAEGELPAALADVAFLRI
ncbi:hypothetical protein BH23GEM9_BH23GEM9_31230 [soil metagenome]